ncbi:hypothetical protein FSP39_020858 [Pinctada imbricata]|uniref:Integrase catalytic domain-containing protein n=1 Tax=Pinctada imbricata TaxID=66713 RepID=A0AA89C0P6_PINIB|nr:hypothetical protein FSP39_020858 [Pinctada imbricata]
MKSDFRRLHNKFDSVFSTSLEGYNGNAGPFKGKVNMGPVLPPQRKGRIPQYSRNQLEELQRKFNELEEHGIFCKPEDVDVTVEYLNPSFLVKKGNGTYRLVTAFTEVGRYSKPQPSLMPDVDSTLRKIGQWKFIVVTDLTKSFYQIPLSHDSMKYCGVVTPFKGIRVYTRCAMGMPGSETALEELTCRVLGDLLEEGIVTKLADDLYCGGNTPQELLENWTKVLEALQKCNLKLSATKTVIAPRTTTILGWIWEQGTLKANPHRIAALSSCEPPKTVKALRSFSGTVKVLARVLPGCSSMLAPLDDAIAGRDSKDNILWDDTLISSFTQVQQSLNSSKTIHIPRTDDTLWIVTDAAVRSPGIGATLYITRGDKILLSGFFSAKLRKHQISWIPCEVEALAIAVAVKHFSPYIVQSSKPTCILTDSKPCVMAYEKVGRGEFSASPRVYTFLSTVSRYQVSVRHVAGSAILPSDFSSRSTPDCIDPTCQVCQFINTTVDSVVRNITVSDILTGKARLPFTSRAAWMSIQAESSDLRRTRAHLLQGTRPSRQITNLPDVKRYLRVATVTHDGLVIVKRSEPFQSSRELIVIPREVLHGILTSLHIQLQHPSRNQLKLVTQRFFYAIDMDKAIDLVTGSCHQCASIQKVPHMLVKEDTGDPPEAIGTSFACDIMKRERQLLLVVRECVTSYTSACIIENEQHDTIRDALIPLCINLRPLDGPPAIIRTDPGPGFIALVNDPLLKDCRLSLEIGRVKNKNKNPVAERAIQELRDEILRLDPTNRTVNTVSLCLALSAVNTRIRSNGLSAREMLTHRNQFTNAQIPVCDRDIILDKHQARLKNHPFSEVSKAPKEKRPDTPSIDIGDLVYLHRDRNKSRARDRYLVVAFEAEWCSIRKFVGNQLRNCSYRVKKSECFRVPSDSNDLYLPTDVVDECSSDDNEEAPAPHAHSYLPPSPAPDIPIEISASGTSDINLPSSVESDDSKPQTMIEPTIDVSMPTEQHTSDRPRRNIRLPSRFNDFVINHFGVSGRGLGWSGVVPAYDLALIINKKWEKKQERDSESPDHPSNLDPRMIYDWRKDVPYSDDENIKVNFQTQYETNDTEQRSKDTGLYDDLSKTMNNFVKCRCGLLAEPVAKSKIGWTQPKDDRKLPTIVDHPLKEESKAFLHTISSAEANESEKSSRSKSCHRTRRKYVHVSPHDDHASTSSAGRSAHLKNVCSSVYLHRMRGILKGWSTYGLLIICLLMNLRMSHSYMYNYQPNIDCPKDFLAHGNTCCAYIKCDPDTRPVSFVATEKDPRACSKRCQCNTTANYCGTDPCKCSIGRCEKHYQLQQDCGCRPTRQESRSTDITTTGTSKDESTWARENEMNKTIIFDLLNQTTASTSIMLSTLYSKDELSPPTTTQAAKTNTTTRPPKKPQPPVIYNEQKHNIPPMVVPTVTVCTFLLIVSVILHRCLCRKGKKKAITKVTAQNVMIGDGNIQYCNTSPLLSDEPELIEKENLM